MEDRLNLIKFNPPASVARMSNEFSWTTHEDLLEKTVEQRTREARLGQDVLRRLLGLSPENTSTVTTAEEIPDVVFISIDSEDYPI